MRSPTVRLAAAFTTLLALAPARTLVAQTNRPAAGHWACFSGFETDTVYVTPVWDGTATMDNVQSGFTQMLATRYGYKGRVSCSRANMAGSTLAKNQADRKAQEAQWEKDGKKVVHTGWTYGSPATPAAPPKKPASPSTSTAAMTGAYNRLTGSRSSTTRAFPRPSSRGAA